MKQIIYLLVIVGMITSCQGKKTDYENISVHKVSFTTQKYKEVSETSKGYDTEIKAQIPVAEGNSTAVKNINMRLFDIVRSIVGQENDRSSDYTELFNAFVMNYEQFVKENPDYPGAWEADVRGTVEYNSDNLINIKIDSYTMMGGAHGMSSRTSFLFDPKTGRELSLKDIVNDTAAVSRIAENKFRKKYNIPAGQPINSTGLMFENNKFALPQSVFIKKDGLLLYYNVYEVAAYAEGTKEITLPYDEIENYLSFNYK